MSRHESLDPSKVVDMARETPELWKTWLRDAGLGSLRDLAKQINVSPSTITRLVHRDGDSNPTTVREVAQALGLDEEVVAAAAGRQWGGVFVPDESAAFLLPAVHEALNHLIRTLAHAAGGLATPARLPTDELADRRATPDLTTQAARGRKKRDDLPERLS